MANWCSQGSGGGTGVPPRTRGGAERSVPERRDVYEQLADELRQGIVSGQYQPGDRLPSTLDLMARTGVANLTVRGAYRVLVEEGLVEFRQAALLKVARGDTSIEEVFRTVPSEYLTAPI